MAKMESTKRADVAVTFHDGRGIAARIDERPAMMQLAFADGTTIHVELGDVGVEGVELSPIALACVWHGAKQKLIDAAAISRDPTTGRAASIGVKYQAVAEVLERMKAGQWFKARGEGSGGAGGLLYRALLEYFAGKKTPDEVRAWLDGKDDAYQAALRKNSAIAAIIDRLRPQPKASDVDVLADLEEFADE